MHWSAAYAAYNVFRRRQYPALRCAVRQDRPVPGFIHGVIWEYGGTVMEERPPEGFRPEQAQAATESAGYYLFRAPCGRA